MKVGLDNGCGINVMLGLIVVFGIIWLAAVKKFCQ